MLQGHTSAGQQHWPAQPWPGTIACWSAGASSQVESGGGHGRPCGKVWACLGPPAIGMAAGRYGGSWEGRRGGPGRMGLLCGGVDLALPGSSHTDVPALEATAGQ